MIPNIKYAIGSASLLIAANYSMATDDTILVGNFSAGDLSHWEPETFAGKTVTRYSLAGTKGNYTLRADSDQSASGLIRKIKIDLSKTPYLNWSWRVDQVLENSNEQDKKGDDFAARIYIVISGGLAFWRTRALNYVWASNTARNSKWTNPFAGENVIMLALRTGAEDNNIWQQEKRNLKTDLKAAFGETITRIDAIALMTDTDNTETTVIAYYGNIFFSAQ